MALCYVARPPGRKPRGLLLVAAASLPYDDGMKDGIGPRNLHVPLPEPLYSRLRAESERSKRPATELAREAIEQWLDRARKEAIREAIARYAAEHAGTSADLDADLEAAAASNWLVDVGSAGETRGGLLGEPPAAIRS